MTEGAMSKLRATYVCESANAKYAKELEIDKLLLLGCGEEKTGGREKDAIINDAFEAFLGALYLTNGLADVKKILEIIVFPHIKANDQVEFIDYKSRLQEFVQSETRNNLEYVEIKKEGPTNNPKFTMNVVLEGIILGTGVGGNKKSHHGRWWDSQNFLLTLLFVLANSIIAHNVIASRRDRILSISASIAALLNFNRCYMAVSNSNCNLCASDAINIAITFRIKNFC